VTKIHYHDGVLYSENGNYETDIDLLIGGSPCQDFSNANKNVTGLAGDKSGLFYQYYRLLQDIHPKYHLLENVRMKPKHEREVNELMGEKPLRLNSSLFSGQNRHRLYWTNIDVDLRQLPKESVSLQDVLDCGYTNRDKSTCLLVSDSRPLRTPYKMFRRYHVHRFTNLVFKSQEHYEQCCEHFNRYFKGLSAREVDAKIVAENIDVSVYDGVRYLTKHESEKLQTLPVGYCDVLSLKHTRDVCGDGWTVDVIAFLLSFMIF